MGLLDTTGFYVIVGFKSRAELLSLGANLKDFPAQADMVNGRRWLRPGNEADIIKPAALVNSISGKRKPYGGFNFKWPLVNLSPMMTDYWHVTYFDGEWFADLTVQTFNRAVGEWQAYQVIAQWPDYTDQAEALAGGFSNFQLVFVNAEAAPDGPDAIITGEYPSAWQVGIPATWELTVSNIGDYATFSDLVVTHTFPADMEFLSTTASGWTPEWSTNGTTYFDFTLHPPLQPRTDVRYLRYTYEDVVEIDGDTTPINILVEPSDTTTMTNTFTVTMVGDILDTNNSLVVVITATGRGFDSGFDNGFGVSTSGFDIGFDGGFSTSPVGFSDGFDFGFGITDE